MTFLIVGGPLSSLCLVSDSITWSDKDFFFLPAAVAFKTTFLRSPKQSCRHHSEEEVKSCSPIHEALSSFPSPLMKMTQADGGASRNPVT